MIRLKFLEEDAETTLKRLSKEQPAKYDARGNGGTEVGVMLLRGLFRTLKLCLGSHLQRFIPACHALAPWLLRHAFFILDV